MTIYRADPSHLRKNIIIFSAIAALLIVLGLVLDTGIGLRRRTSDITLEGAMIVFGLLSLFPVLFAFLRQSPERCSLRSDGKFIEYRNVQFGWPVAQHFRFSSDHIQSLETEDETVKIVFGPDSKHYDKDRSDDDFDLEIDAEMFGLTARDLREFLTKS